MPADDFLFREATPADVPGLARLHVTTFIETHGGPGPTSQLREHQWREAFDKQDGTWFCVVIEGPGRQLIGFAKGEPYTDRPSDFSGELNKFYILREYHRRGLGRRLIGRVARRFLGQGITSTLLFGDAGNPSNGFYESLGAERLITPKGEFHGGYGWRDLRKLAEICPID